MERLARERRVGRAGEKREHCAHVLKLPVRMFSFQVCVSAFVPFLFCSCAQGSRRAAGHASGPLYFLPPEVVN